MKTQSDVMPTSAYAIEKITDRDCEVVFISNVKEIEQEEKIYEYDLYRIKAKYRETLANDIEDNYGKWLDEAIRIEMEQEKYLSDKEKIIKLENENEELKVKSRNLEISNTIQDEMIDINMCATDEIFMMIEPLLPQSKLRMGVKSSMVDMYVAMVLRGLKTIEEVPARYREEVRKIIEQLEA